MKVSVSNKRSRGRNGSRHTPLPIPSPSDFYKTLGLAQIYLEDGAPITALQLIGEALKLADTSPAEDEDLGDVSTHILQRTGVRVSL